MRKRKQEPARSISTDLSHTFIKLMPVICKTTRNPRCFLLSEKYHCKRKYKSIIHTAERDTRQALTGLDRLRPETGAVAAAAAEVTGDSRTPTLATTATGDGVSAATDRRSGRRCDD